MSIHPETSAITAGRPEAAPDASLNPPIVLSSTFHAGGPVGYGRYGIESWSALETAIGELEGGATLSFSSGMAAINTVFSILPIGAPVVASNQGYSGTVGLLHQMNATGRLEVRFVEITNTDEVIAAAKKLGIGVAVDNTFATPLVQQPLSMGADIVMHSVTKFLAGHSDVVLGSLSTNDQALFKRLEEARRFNGSIPGPFEAWLAVRGIRSFPVHFRAAESNAKELVQRLSGHAKVTKVRYPGFGAVVSFEVDGTAEQAEKVCESSKLITHATSLGGIESLWERRRRWALESPSVPEQLIRLSVGCEHVDDLWADINQALTVL